MDVPPGLEPGRKPLPEPEDDASTAFKPESEDISDKPRQNSTVMKKMVSFGASESDDLGATSSAISDKPRKNSTGLKKGVSFGASESDDFDFAATSSNALVKEMYSSTSLNQAARPSTKKSFSAGNSSSSLALNSMTVNNGHRMTVTAGQIKRLKGINFEEQENEEKESDVRQYYSEDGCASQICRSELFNNITLFVISCNALWMGYETQYNTAKTLSEADIGFFVGENAFCAYFTFELLIRFLAFEHKTNCLKDGWFKFDAALVAMMVVDTWIMNLIVGDAGPGPWGNAGVLKLLRLLRLSRMARLMRSVPELVTLFKGLAAGLRSVSTTFLLLLVIIYVFGIVFKLQLGDSSNETMYDYFNKIPRAMLILFLAGTLLDECMSVLDSIKEESMVMVAVFFLFIVISAILVMNMLIGVLCEVITEVSSHEKDAAVVNFVRAELLTVLEDLDEDGSSTVSVTEFKKLVEDDRALMAMEQLGIDLKHLKSIGETLFETEFHAQTSDDTTRRLSWAEFLDILLVLRSNKSIAVANIMELRKFVRFQCRPLHAQMKAVQTQQRHLGNEVSGLHAGLNKLQGSVKDLHEEVQARKKLLESSQLSISKAAGDCREAQFGSHARKPALNASPTASPVCHEALGSSDQASGFVPFRAEQLAPDQGTAGPANPASPGTLATPLWPDDGSELKTALPRQSTGGTTGQHSDVDSERFDQSSAPVKERDYSNSSIPTDDVPQHTNGMSPNASGKKKPKHLQKIRKGKKEPRRTSEADMAGLPQEMVELLWHSNCSTEASTHDLKQLQAMFGVDDPSNAEHQDN